MCSSGKSLSFSAWSRFSISATHAISHGATPVSTTLGGRTGSGQLLTLWNDKTMPLGDRSDVHKREYRLRLEELHPVFLSVQR